MQSVYSSLSTNVLTVDNHNESKLMKMLKIHAELWIEFDIRNLMHLNDSLHRAKAIMEDWRREIDENYEFSHKH